MTIIFRHIEIVIICKLRIWVTAILQKSDEHEQAPPVPWRRHMLSWILVQPLIIPLCKLGCLGCKRDILILSQLNLKDILEKKMDLFLEHSLKKEKSAIFLTKNSDQNSRRIPGPSVFVGREIGYTYLILMQRRWT